MLQNHHKLVKKLIKDYPRNTTLGDLLLLSALSDAQSVRKEENLQILLLQHP